MIDMNNQEGLQKLEKIKKFAKLLDSQFRIPGTKIKFGIDPLLSLIPILGTFSGFISGLILIFLSHRQGVSGKVKTMMFKNVCIDYVYGLVPIFGNIKDVFYKSNEKNVKLLEEHLLEDRHQGSGLGLVLQLIAIILVLLLISILLSVFLLKWMIGLFETI